MHDVNLTRTGTISAYSPLGTIRIFRAPSMTSSTASPIESLVDHISKLDELVRETQRSLRPNKPWARDFLASLGEMATQLQVLRMSVSADKSLEELLECADLISSHARVAEVRLLKSSAPGVNKVAARLLVSLAGKVELGLKVALGGLPN